MIENILNREYVLPKYKRYRPLDLSCPCGCEEYVCDRDLISVIIDIQKTIGDEELEFSMRPCCQDYARRIGQLNDSPFAIGKAIEIIKPFCIDTLEELEDIAIECGAIHTEIDNTNEILYLDIIEEDND